MSILGVPQQILETVASSGLGAYSVLTIVVLIYLVLGCFFDGLSLMIMTLPVVFPLLTGLGFVGLCGVVQVLFVWRGDRYLDLFALVRGRLAARGGGA